MFKVKSLVAVCDHAPHPGPKIFNSFLLKFIDGNASWIVTMKRGISTGNYHGYLCAKLRRAVQVDYLGSGCVEISVRGLNEGASPPVSYCPRYRILSISRKPSFMGKGTHGISYGFLIGGQPGLTLTHGCYAALKASRVDVYVLDPDPSALR
ncbi:hypothetical protein [Arthrobacter sp. SAFR-044]|uniref:hypothetical protein n=1 Tax=Arthrobacter sp. SAFR-044 TaxID=3387278 RepID=UPI003F7C81F5